MSYLKAVPRTSETEPPARAVTVVSPDAREVVYLDQSASIEIITEALKAWGLRVRADRGVSGTEPPHSSAPIALSEDMWQTTRPEVKAPTRLENALSPLWFPIRNRAVETHADWSWFGRAA